MTAGFWNGRIVLVALLAACSVVLLHQNLWFVLDRDSTLCWLPLPPSAPTTLTTVTTVDESLFSRQELAQCRWMGYIGRGFRSNTSGLNRVDGICGSVKSLQVNRPIRPRHSATTTQNKLALCAVHKNGEAYIDEWVDYHLALGVSQIHIYDNSDEFSLGLWAALKLQEEGQGRVLVTHAPNRSQQLTNYKHCYQRLRDSRERITWVATLDLDEYLVLKQHGNVLDFLQEYLGDHDVDNSNTTIVGSLALNWRLFSASPPADVHVPPQWSYQPLPLTQRCTWRRPSTNKNIKAFSKLSAVSTPWIHHDNLRRGYHQVDTRGTVFRGPWNRNGPTDVAVVHHFRVPTLHEYFVKACVRGSAAQSKNLLCSEDSLADLHKLLRSFTVQDNTTWKAMQELLPEYQQLAPGGPAIVKAKGERPGRDNGNILQETT